MKKYQFAVSAATDVDIQRICAKAPKEVEAILVTGRPSRDTANGALLLIRDSFAGRFNQFDMVALAGETLNPQWGEARIVPGDMDGQVKFFISWQATTTVITGWRGKPLTQTSIPEVLTQLAAAHQHLVRKRTVTVRYV